MNRSTMIATLVLILSSAVGLILIAILFFQLRSRRAAPPTVNYSRAYKPVRSTPGSDLILEQLNESLTAVIKTFPLRLTEGDGIFISRGNCQAPGVLLKIAGEFSNTVSQRHAIIGVDAQGFFIQDNNSANGMFVYGDPTPQEEVSIHDGMIICLGNQPIRFRIPGNANKRITPNENSPVYGTKGDRA